jgi:hypothetical protein
MQMVKEAKLAECRDFGNLASGVLGRRLEPKRQRLDCFPKNPPAAWVFAEPTFGTPRSYIERRKPRAKRLIRHKKNVRTGGVRLILKKSKRIDGRQAGEYAGDLPREKG